MKKNKLLFFIHSLRHGGAERVVLEINNYLKHKNIDTKIVTWVNHNQYKNNKKYGKIETKYLLNKKDYNWLFSIFKSLALLNSLLIKEKPDVIHVNSVNAFFLVLLSNFNKEIIYLVHGYAIIESKFVSKNFYFRVLSILLIKFKNISFVAVSKKIIPKISNFFKVPKKNISFINNGIDVDYFKNANQKNLSSIKNIIMVGTLGPYKGQFKGVKIFRKLLKKDNKFKLYILGQGPDESLIKNYIKENNLSNKIKMIGSTNNVKDYLKKSHLIWQLSESEGLPLSVLEAMSMGIPCVGFNVRGINEVIQDGYNGYLVEYDDTREILNKTLRIFENKLRYKKFKANSIFYSRKYFSSKLSLSKHLNLIRDTFDKSLSFKIKIKNLIFLNFFPKNFIGDKIFNFIKFCIYNKRFPYFKKSINDEIYRIKSSKEILDPLRLKTTSKYDVKKFLKKIGLGEFCIPTIKIINTEKELSKFKFKKGMVVKADHGSGLIKFILDNDHKSINILKSWLKLNYYEISREPNYKNLKKRLIVEPILFDGSGIKDYKFFCYNGVIKFCQVDLDRWGNHARKFYDINWKDLNFSILHPQSKKSVKKPTNLKKIIYITEKVAKKYDGLVRIDMYTNNRKIYFGEITHSPGSGTEMFIPRNKEDIISKLFFK